MTAHRISQLKEIISLEETRSDLQQKIDALDEQIADLQNTLYNQKGKPNVQSKRSSTVGGRKRRGALREEILETLAAAGDKGVSVQDLAVRLNTKPANIHSWFSTNLKKTKSLKKVGEARYALIGAAPEAPAAVAAPTAEAPAAEAPAAKATPAKAKKTSASIEAPAAPTAPAPKRRGRPAKVKTEQAAKPAKPAKAVKVAKAPKALKVVKAAKAAKPAKATKAAKAPSASATAAAAPALKKAARGKSEKPAKASKTVAAPAAKTATKAAAVASDKGPSKRGELKEQILAALKAAGPKGITITDLSEQLSVKYKNLYIWFVTTGKRIEGIHKVGRAQYALS